MKNLKTILIADDNPENLKLLSNILKEVGYDVRVALNGQQAYDSVLAEQPDLIMLDIQMPIMDGYEACEKIKMVDKLKAIPIIFISAMSEAFNKVLAFEAGGADYITKPFQVEEVRIRVGNQIKLADQQQQLEEVNMMLFDQFKSTFEQAAVGIAHININNNKFIKVNKHLSRFFGLSSKELLTKTILDLTHPDDLNKVEKAKESLLNGTIDSITIEKKCIKNDNSFIWGRCTLSMVKYSHGNLPKHLLAIFEDISSNKKAEELNIKLSRVIEQSPVSVIITNTNGIIEFANPKVTEITGYQLSELIGKKPSIFSSGTKPKQEYYELWETISIGKEWHGEFYNRKKNGELFWEAASISPIISEANIITHYVALKEDISEKKNLLTELVNAKDKAEESDRLKTAFLQNMSHEIRTPMNAVIGFSQILMRDHLSPIERKTYSEYIQINGESLVKIIDDIIDISKLQSKQLTIKKSIFNLNLLFNELEFYYSGVLANKPNKQIALTIDIPYKKDDEFLINSDPLRLKQVLNNLISNAVKYTCLGQITFGYKIMNNELQFYVQDTGAGISAKNQTQIFERFYQHSDKYLSKQEGTGLGLPIAKELVTILGGKLKVKSQEEKGSLFYFNLPIIQNKTSQKVKENKASSNIDLSDYKVLIADDEDSNYVLTKRLLCKTKIITDWAPNGSQAVEMSNRTHYDLIIMDIKMPEMDGIEATRLIKKRNASIPIIIQTAFAMEEAKTEAFKAGCNDFIMKPISTDVFLQLVTKHILNSKNSITKKR